MPSAQIYFPEAESRKIVLFAEYWKVSKHDAVIRIVKEFTVEEDIKKKMKEQGYG